MPYQCPMHCEGTKTYEKSGSCPVCHMYLEKEPEPGAEKGPLSSKDYRMELVSRDNNDQRNYFLNIELVLRRTADDSVVKELDEVDGVNFEVYLTDQNLSFMEALKAKTMEDGKFRFSREFGQSGNYLLFAVAKPTGVREQVFPLALKVTVPKEKRKNLPKVKSILPVGKYGFYVIVSEDTTYFVREHANMKEPIPREKLKSKLPKAGKYTIFVDAPGGGTLKKISLTK